MFQTRVDDLNNDSNIKYVNIKYVSNEYVNIINNNSNQHKYSDDDIDKQTAAKFQAYSCLYAELNITYREDAKL